MVSFVCRQTYVCIPVCTCSCHLSGQVLSVFTALLFPSPIFHLCVIFTLPFLPGTQCMCLFISPEQSFPSFLAEFLLPMLFLHPAACYQLMGTSKWYQKPFAGLFFAAFTIFFSAWNLLWGRTLFLAVVDALRGLCGLVPLWFLFHHLFLKRMTWSTKPCKLYLK